MSTPATEFSGPLSRRDFPEGFLFGSASSAFQYEGAHNVDGRLPSIWDTFLTETHPDIVAANGLDAVEFYYRYKEDIKAMKDIGLDTFRFSLSWPRILPKGRRTRGPNNEEQGVNKLAIDFYNKVINLLLENGIEPSVTLFHWDFPQALETEYLGFLSEKSVADFVDYADLCFREFGDRVKYWMTFNETWSYSLAGYLIGNFAPGRGSTNEAQRQAMVEVIPSSLGSSRQAFAHSRTPRAGDPSTEPYIVTHNQLLAHAAAVKLYRTAYQNAQKGKIGIGLVTIWAEPHNDTQEDRDAAQRVLDFMLGWLFDPVVFGKYPESMRRLLGNRLPEFKPHQLRDLIGSFDFIGMNYYTTNSVANLPYSRSIIYNPDSHAICYPMGVEAGSSWVYSYPQGLLKLLLYVKEKYNNPLIYITENGIDEINDEKLTLWEALYDTQRISYHKQHLEATKQAISQGADVRGYYAWSFTDNLEWASGFDSRFGLNYVHFGRELERYPKLSAGWFKFFLEK
nr:strictosidine-beta-D-glucosidase [Uncaria rhynchophylla]